MNPCLEFGGRKDGKGYGRVWINGRYVFAHRFAYCVAKGIQLEEINGLLIRHACDNPACINPNHLCTGTNQDNVDDMVSRKRNAKYEKHGAAKLTEENVKEIRRIYVPRHPVYGAKPLSKMFGVHASAISKVITGERWKGLKE